MEKKVSFQRLKKNRGGKPRYKGLIATRRVGGKGQEISRCDEETGGGGLAGKQNMDNRKSL